MLEQEQLDGVFHRGRARRVIILLFNTENMQGKGVVLQIHKTFKQKKHLFKASTILQII